MRPSLTLFLSLVLVSTARADRFWLETPGRDNTDGAAVIDGVLLGEDQHQFHIRVVGGELWLEKARVTRVEKNGMTVEHIQKSEAEAAERQAAAEAERQRAQAVGATSRQAKAMAVAAREASLATVDKIDPPAPPAAETLVYSPVIHALVPAQPVTDRDVMRDLELAYELTRDRAYVRLLRKMRRLR